MARILVVDDEGDQRFLLRRLLERAGHEVVEAIHGRSALDCLGTDEFEMVITDLQMPVMDGRALIGTLRADAASSSLPVIVCTGVVEPDVDADEIVDKTRTLAVAEAVERLLRKGS